MDLSFILTFFCVVIALAGTIYFAYESMKHTQSPADSSPAQTLPEPASLVRALTRCVRGYVFLYFNFNLGTINLLPGWAGFLFLYCALDEIGKYQPSALLLKPLGLILAGAEAVSWILAIFGMEPDWYLFTLIISILNLYFHFQLLTNLADIARDMDYPKADSLLALRTANTIFITLMALPFPWKEMTGIAFLILAADLIILIWIIVTLRSFRKYVEEKYVGE